MTEQDGLKIGSHVFQSRLIVGTGKYQSVAETAEALAASGTELITVALRRVDLKDKSSGSLLTLLQSKRWKLLPNTAGCYTAEEAVRTLRLARELGMADLVKLEVIGDPRRSTRTTSKRSKPLPYWSKKDSRCCRTASMIRSCVAS